MKFNWRKTVAVGPLWFRFANGRFTSWGIQVGRFRHNVTRRRSTLDTPGPGSVSHEHGRRGR